MNAATKDLSGLSQQQRELLELRLADGRRQRDLPVMRSQTERHRPFPLSLTQQRIWLAHELDPQGGGYNISGAFMLRGKLQTAALEKSLTKVVERHETLRTRFASLDDRVVQIVEPPGKFTLSRTDLSQLESSAREQVVAGFLREEAHRPFDLKSGKLLRAQLLVCSSDYHVLLLSMHHIAADGWSAGILIGEVGTFYEAYALGKQVHLSELPLQYADFALAESNGSLTSSTELAQIAYWRGQLAGCPDLELAADRPRPAVRTSAGARASLLVGKEATAALQRLSEQEGASLFMTLATCVATLLARYTKQRDLCVGTSVGNRSDLATEGVVGCFMNLLALRIDLSGEPTFREALGRMREVVLAALDHGNLSFDRLIEVLHPPRALNRTPFFQVLFEYHKQAASDFETAGLRWSPIPGASTAAKYDLSLVATESDDGLRWSAIYSAALFEAQTIERMLTHLEVVLTAVGASPDQPVSRIPLLSEAERSWYITGANDLHLDLPVPYVHQLLEAQAAMSPAATALKHDQRELSYQDMNRRANQLAHFLISRGTGAESFVGVFMNRSIEMMVALFGVLKAGGAYVPLDPTYPVDRLRYMCEDARLATVLTTENLMGTLAIDGVDEVALDRDWQTLMGNRSTQNPDLHMSPLNLAYVIYTSGSTGRPKGVMISHEGIANYVVWAADAYQAANGRGAVVHSPVGFDMTLTGLFPPLVVGKCVEVVSEAPGVQLLQEKLLGTRDFSLLKITPAHVELLNRQVSPEALRGRVNTLVVGADAVTAAPLTKWRTDIPDTRIFNEYGPTETVVGCANYLISEKTAQTGAVPIGFPIVNMQMYVLDQHLEPVPIGVAGELYIGGIGVARGYLNRPDLTAERFVPDPFSKTPGARLYRTGDASRYLPDRDGHIEFLGRLDFQVKLRGFRIELSEIESVLLRHPAVREAVVVEEKDSVGEQRLVAYIVPQTGLIPRSSEVRDFLKRQLPDYMLPSGIVVLETMPLTPNGKVDRRALHLAPQQLQMDAGTSEPALVTPRDAYEERLAKLWEDVLDFRPIGVTDNFFEVGGHSLLAHHLVLSIQKEFGRTITISAFFQAPTIEGIASQLHTGTDIAGHGNDRTPMVALKPEGNRIPFFCVHSLSGDVAIFGDLVRSMPADRPFFAFQTLHPSELGDKTTSIAELAHTYVTAMLAQRRSGPYHLGGYSFGCVIAFEMACLLKQLGHEVGSLILIDGISPLRVRQMGDRGDAVTFAGIVRDWARVGGVELELPHETIRQMQPEQGLNFILEKLQATDLLERGQDLQWVRAFLRGIQNRTKAIREYSPRTYDGIITLMRSNEIEIESAKALIESGVDVLDPARGWNELTSRPLDLHFVSGHHATLLKAPHVELLAAEIANCLSEIEVPSHS